MYRSITLYMGVKLSALTSENRLIALTSRLAAVGIMLGVATLITVLAVMRGFEYEIRHSLVKDFDHLQVFAFNHHYPQALYDELESLKHVKSVTGYAQSYALMRNIETYMPVMLLSFASTPNGMDLPSLAHDGVYLSSHHNVHYDVGDRVDLVLPQKNRIMPKKAYPSYLGPYDMGFANRGFMTALVPYPTYQELVGNDRLSGLSIVVDDLYATSTIKQYLQERYAGMYQGFDWQDKYRPLFSALRMQRMVMIFILSMITLVSMFSLVSGLVMLSSDRVKEIALLRTMGMSRRRISKIFMIQGIFISGVGILLGVMLGSLLCYYAQDITVALERLLDLSLVDKKVYGVTKLPVLWSYGLVLMVAANSFIIGVLASIFPAKKAAKINPAQVLRYV